MPAPRVFIAATILLLAAGGAVAGSSGAELDSQVMKGKPAALVIAENGRTAYRIVIPRDATPSQEYAADELQRFIKEMSGARLPVVTDGEKPAGREILLGNNSRLPGLGISVDWARLGKEGCLLRTAGNNLVIAGSPERGTLYGVYALLEDHWGCRWYTSDASLVPRREKLILPGLDETIVPRLEYREVFWTEAFGGDWAARNRLNSANASLEEGHGGKIAYKGFVHTMDGLVPADLFDAHPEYFAMRDGKRRKDDSQRCLTNPDVLYIATENVRKWLKESPEANIVSVSQNDNFNYCECATCHELDEAEGSHAGTMLYFVNCVAEAIEGEFPNVAVDTLAYQYTRKPPRTIKPRPNVIVRLCSIECCFSHPLDGCPEDTNTSFVRDLKGWNELTKRLYIWDYTTNFSHYLLLFPNLDMLDRNVRTFADNGVAGIFEQGNYSKGGGGALSELKAWVLAKLLWNPELDGNSLIREFVKGAYGPAAVPVMKYIGLGRDAIRESGEHVRIFDDVNRDYLNPVFLRKADDLLEKAERIAARSGDRKLLARVRRLRMPVWYTLAAQAIEPFDKVIKPAVKRLVETARNLGYTNFHEWTGVESDYTRLDILLKRKPAKSSLPGALVGEDYQFRLYREGDLVSLVLDPTALDGAAARQAGCTFEWSVQWIFPAPPAGGSGTTCRLRARIRVEKKGGSGPAFHVGVYDATDKIVAIEAKFPAEEIPDQEYRWYEIGDVEWKPGCYAYVAPDDNEAVIPAIYVDRFELVPK